MSDKEEVEKRGQGWKIEGDTLIITGLDYDDPRNQPNHAFPPRVSDIKKDSAAR
jgi:hypothetical protein